MSASSSTIYKIGDDSIFDDAEVVEDTENYSEVLVTIQNNLVDIHTLGSYILLALGLLIGIGVIKAWKQ